MADFTHTFTLTAIADDGRTITMSNTDVIEEVDGVWSGYASQGATSQLAGPTFASFPKMSSEPILSLFQAVGDGCAIEIENTNGDSARVDPANRQVFTMHGTETYEVGTNAATATCAETLELFAFDNSASNSSVSYFILLGPTS